MRIGPRRVSLRSVFLGTVLCLLSGAGISGRVAVPASSQPAPWHSKVAPSLLAASRSASSLEFIVEFAGVTDLRPAERFADRTARLTWVAQTLRATAERSQSAVIDRLRTLGVRYRSFWIANIILVDGTPALMDELAQRPEVIAISPNTELRQPLEPAEPAAPADAHAGVEWNVTKIGAPQAWAEGYRGQGVVVGGQDTGYQWNHPAIIRQYRGWDGTLANHNYNWHDAFHEFSEPTDDHGHGTHTMGTVLGNDLAPTDAAWPAGATNATGVAPAARWIGCRNMKSGNGTVASYTECYQWFVAPTDRNDQNPNPALAPHVITNSWGCPPSEGCTQPAILLTAVQNVRAAGILTVHSAGNEGPNCSTVTSPGQIYAESLTVGSTNSSDVIASSSSRGPVTADGSGRMKPDLSAPGVSVRSSVTPSSYATFSGTSMAAPHVAGAVALILSARPSLAGNVSALEQALTRSAVPRTTTQGCGGDSNTAVPNNVYGWGRLDAYAAVHRALDLPAAPAITTQPTGVATPAGSTASFSAAASGVPAPTVQWQVSGNGGSTWVDVSGATASTLSFATIAGHNGQLYRAVFTNASGTATTNAVTLTVYGALSVDIAALRFDATKAGASGSLLAVTPAQKITVSYAGAASNWSVGSQQTWLQVTSGSGSSVFEATRQFTVAVVNPGNVIGGSTSLSGSVIITSPTAPNAPMTIPVALTVDQTGGTLNAAPVGAFDTPADSATGLSGSFAVTGWALDDMAVDRVEIWRDLVTGEPSDHAYTTDPNHPARGKVFIANPYFVSGSRPDIESHPIYGSYPMAYRSGWGYLLLSWGLWTQTTATGPVPYTLYAFAFDKDGRNTLLGTKAITVDNAHATKPFGAIDTPVYGGTVSGSFWNFGWALTPNVSPPCTIQNGRVFMSIDSGPLVAVNYGDPRTDIAASFPGFTNGTNSGGAYFIDTTGLANGLHQIGWLVYDNCNRGDGIGSRFFNVLNAGGDAVDGPTRGSAPTPAGDQRQARLAPGDPRLPAESPSPRLDDSVTAWDRQAPAWQTGITVRHNLGAWAPIEANGEGVYSIDVAQGERIEIQLPATTVTWTAHHAIGGERRALPIGSFFDAQAGRFAWQPAPGFLGTFDLVFAGSQHVRLRLTVRRDD